MFWLFDKLFLWVERRERNKSEITMSLDEWQGKS